LSTPLLKFFGFWILVLLWALLGDLLVSLSLAFIIRCQVFSLGSLAFTIIFPSLD
jgi:hypothetical protein